MRKIAKEAKEAFDKQARFTKSNTQVRVEGNVVYMYLFGRAIVKKENDEIFICNGNYDATITTADRLSAFIPVRKRKGQLIVKEKVVLDHNWLNINEI